MRVATIDTKIKGIRLREASQAKIMTRLCFQVQHGIKQQLLEHFLAIYVEKFKKYNMPDVDERQHSLLCLYDAFVLVKNIMTDTVIMFCTRDECNMFYYDESSGHVQKRAYAYWQDQILEKLLTSQVNEQNQSTFTGWQTLHGDVLGYMSQWLPCETLLNCTLVNKWWRDALVKRAWIWSNRMQMRLELENEQAQCMFQWFIKSSGLFASLEPPNVEACLTKNLLFGLHVLENIAAAWIHFHRDFLHSHDLYLTSGFYPTRDMLDAQKEYAPVQKRLKLLEERKNPIAQRHQLMTARELLNQNGHNELAWHNQATAKHVNAYMSGTINLNQPNGDRRAAVVWLGADGVLKITDFRVAKGYVKASKAKQVLHKMIYNWLDANRIK